MSLTRALVFFLAAAAFQPKIPRAWTDADVASLELPLANPQYSPTHVSSEAYYKIPARILYKSYPVYHPDREPAGYQDFLKNQEPEVAFDPANLKTQQDWIKAGELVFNAPTSHGAVFFGAQDVRDRRFFEQTHVPVAKDGTVPFARWVIRKKGEVELGSMGCATCHTRVLPDGAVLPGAQGNNPGDRQGAWTLRRAAAATDPDKIRDRMRGFARQFEMPWLPDDPNRRPQTMSLDELIAAGEAIPPGVTARSNTSMLFPPQIPDLIGVEERRYLDHTGLVRHRGVGDLMRYSSLAQDVFTLDRYGDGPAPRAGHGARYSDEQLYALVLYLYSLKPPPNPNLFDESAARGKRIFERERCARCHAAPLYTNNKLVPADGFDPPASQPDALPTSIGVDPNYALRTHKGTGYYKVPSLKGVWYRGPFEHNGSVAALEDWFDPARLRDDYVPTGFKGYDGKRRSVPGHRFGLNLEPAEKQSLMAFLKTL